MGRDHLFFPSSGWRCAIYNLPPLPPTEPYSCKPFSFSFLGSTRVSKRGSRRGSRKGGAGELQSEKGREMKGRGYVFRMFICSDIITFFVISCEFVCVCMSVCILEWNPKKKKRIQLSSPPFLKDFFAIKQYILFHKCSSVLPPTKSFYLLTRSIFFFSLS